MGFTAVPSLSQDGWVTNPKLALDYLLGHFFSAEYSQDPIYRGQITSLQWFVQQYYNSPLQMASALERALTIYFGRYSTNVVVEVKASQDSTNSNNYTVSIFAEMDDGNGGRVSISQAKDVSNSRIAAIVAANNG
jgi:hypothetical protein